MVVGGGRRVFQRRINLLTLQLLVTAVLGTRHCQGRVLCCRHPRYREGERRRKKGRDRERVDKKGKVGPLFPFLLTSICCLSLLLLSLGLFFPFNFFTLLSFLLFLSLYLINILFLCLYLSSTSPSLCLCLYLFSISPFLCLKLLLSNLSFSTFQTNKRK